MCNFNFNFSDDGDSQAHRVSSDKLKFTPQMVLQLTFLCLSIDERLPGGPAVSASSHHLISLSEVVLRCAGCLQDRTQRTGRVPETREVPGSETSVSGGLPLAQAQEERSQRSAQDCFDQGELCWTAACEGIGRRLLMYLEDSEVAKVREPGRTSLVSKRIKDQYCAHCEASKKNEKRKKCFRSLDNEKMRSTSKARRDGMNNLSAW